jgi:hypothetical protein
MGLLFVGLGELNFSLLDSSALGGDVAEHVVVDGDVLDPVTKAGSGLRFGVDNLGGEVLVVEDVFDGFEVRGGYSLLIDIILVVLQLVQESLRVFELH